MSFAIVVIINKAFKLFQLVLVVYCDSCWYWWYPGNSAGQKKRLKHSINTQRHLYESTHPPGPSTPPRTRYTPWDQVHLRDQVHPPDRVHPWDQVHLPGPGTPPRKQRTLADTVNARAVRILLECNLVQDFFLLFLICFLHSLMNSITLHRLKVT